MNIVGFYIFVTIIEQSISHHVPFVRDGYLSALSGANTTTTVRSNITCDACLCDAFNTNISTNYVALNCFNNKNTCEFFHSFPLTYKINSSAGSQLYILQNTLPPRSQCCMPNITDLLAKLTTAGAQISNLPFQAAAFGYDELNPNEAVVSKWEANSLYWFDPTTLTFLRNNSVVNGMTITLYKNQTFTSVTASRSIHVRDTKLLSLAVNISYTSFDNVRKIIFLNDGKTMAVTTQNAMSVTLFNVHSPFNYSYQQQLPCPLTAAHGAAKVNESFFYVSTWSARSIASYSYENGNWTYRLVVNNQLTSAGSHMAVDDCDRIWFVDTQFGLRIFDSSGTLIGNWSMGLNSSSWIYDVLLLPNYVVLVSHYQQSKLSKYDPQLTCS